MPPSLGLDQTSTVAPSTETPTLSKTPSLPFPSKGSTIRGSRPGDYDPTTNGRVAHLRDSRKMLSGFSKNFTTNSNPPSQPAIIPVHAVFSEVSFDKVLESLNKVEVTSYNDFTSRVDAAKDQHNADYPDAKMSVLGTYEEPYYTADLLIEDEQNTLWLEGKMWPRHLQQMWRARKAAKAD